MGAYVYYSYEEHGRGYIGSRSRRPEGDDGYLGSYTDKTFNPTEKVVIAEFETWSEALEAEVELHNFFEVDVNPHFANKAKQTAKGWLYRGGRGSWSEEERKRRTGGKHSEEWKRNQSKGWTEEHRKRKGAQSREALTGVPKSDEACDNMRKAKVGKKWMTNGKESRQAEPYSTLPEGWRWGRPKGCTRKRG